MHSWTPSSSAVTVGLQQVIGRSSCYRNHYFYWLMPGTAIDHALSQQQAVQEGLPLRINPNPYQPPIKTSWRGKKEQKKRKKKKRKRKKCPNILLNPRFLPRCDGVLRGTFACKYGGKKITDKKRKPILDSKRGGRERKKKGRTHATANRRRESEDYDTDNTYMHFPPTHTHQKRQEMAYFGVTMGGCLFGLDRIENLTKHGIW